MSWRGLALGAVGLAVLDAILTHEGAAGNVGGWIESAANVVNRFLNPTIPLFSTTASSSTTSPSGTVGGGVVLPTPSIQIP